MRNTINTPLNDTAGYTGAHCVNSSAVSWPAIIAGAFVATVVSLGLMLFGSSLGLAIVSPWGESSNTAIKVTAYVISWMVIMQWVSAALGGYLTGRLRNRWVGTQPDEVFFRDTAHGFLAWTVATVFTAAFLASAVSCVVGGGVQSATTVAAASAASDEGNGYYVDSLFRSERPSASASNAQSRQEVKRIFVRSMSNGEFTDADKSYLSRVIANEAGISQAEATSRIDNTIVEAKKAADTARKTSATLAIFAFLSMLVGAFIACVAAALGGRHRDLY